MSKSHSQFLAEPSTSSIIAIISATITLIITRAAAVDIAAVTPTFLTSAIIVSIKPARCFGSFASHFLPLEFGYSKSAHCFS